MSSSSTLRTPSRVSASLSRVCEAASTNRVSRRLSLISACFSVQSPWMTLTKSYTTRRSQPMIRSRLRRPMSKSITATFLPLRASPQDRLAEVVVLPTPPLPEVTTMISVTWWFLPLGGWKGGSGVEAGEAQFLARQQCLHRTAGQFRRQLLEDLEHAGHGDQFGPELGGEHARGAVAAHAGHGAAAQRAVHVHAAVGHHLGAGADRADDHEVALARIQAL